MQPAVSRVPGPKLKSRLQTRREPTKRVPRNADALDWGGLKALLGFQMRQAQAALYREFAAKLRHLDLTQRQYAALVLVDANPGISQIAISNALGMDRATVMAIIRRLEQRGCIDRTRASDDRRRQELVLTEAGQTLTVNARKAVAEHESRFGARFSGEELTAFKQMLARISQA
ncbi:MAG: MarR family transcriptional regulator [Caulobacteraceae bacterium]